MADYEVRLLVQLVVHAKLIELTMQNRKVLATGSERRVHLLRTQSIDAIRVGSLTAASFTNGSRRRTEYAVYAE